MGGPHGEPSGQGLLGGRVPGSAAPAGPEDWDAYYGPIREQLDRLRDDPEADEVVALHDAELAAFDAGGRAQVEYRFFVVRAPR